MSGTKTLTGNMPNRRRLLGGIVGIAGSLAGNIVTGHASSETRNPARDVLSDAGSAQHTSLFQTAKGRPYRGVALGDAVLARHGRPASDYEILAREWKADIVRLSLHPGVWLLDSRKALAAVETQAAQARAAGLAVIIDWHPIGWPDGPEEHADPSWGMPERSYASDLKLAQEFWRQVSARFSDDDEVIFEIWNEPVRLDRRGGSSAPGHDWSELRPIWLELCHTIRANADNRLIVAGGRWASDLTGIRTDPLPDRRTGYSWHVYPGSGGGNLDRLETLLDGLAQEQSVFVSEWGFGGRAQHLRGTAEDFGNRFARRFLDGHMLAWTSWCWHPTWEPSLIEADWRTPTPAGHFIKKLLAT